MKNNYFTAAYAAQSLFKIWTQGDKKIEGQASGKPARRQLVFINSAGAFVGIPGYTAYTRKSSVSNARRADTASDK